MKETNMEHFRSEIEEANYTFSICNGEVIKGCSSFYCSDCGFSRAKNEDNRRCTERKIKWLMSKYKPEPVLTAREKGFVECIDGGYIARSEKGLLRWSEDKPEKQDERGRWLVDFELENVTLPSKLFPFITWEDEEPWAVEELRKLKVEE